MFTNTNYIKMSLIYKSLEFARTLTPRGSKKVYFLNVLIKTVIKNYLKRFVNF